MAQSFFSQALILQGHIEEDRMEEEEEEVTETTEMLIDVESMEIEGEGGGHRGRSNMSRIEFWARGGINHFCGEKCQL